MTDENTAPLASGATVADVPPEVTRFVGKVRQQLSDLEPETQDELLDGLVADLSDRVAEDGPEALGDPTAYAGELRAAAGLAPRARVRVPKIRARRPAVHGVGPRLDAAHSLWDRTLARQNVLSPALLETLRPVWWVLRAWVVVQTADALAGSSSMGVIPSIRGPLVGGLVFLIAALGSVQIGRGLVWPGTSSSTGPRVALLAGNIVALALLPAVVGWLQEHSVEAHYYDNGYPESVPTDLTNDGSTVFNIFPYDAQGRPLTGVQLFDQDGHRLSATKWSDGTRYDKEGLLLMTFPWRNGDAKLWNVYPRPEQGQDEMDDSIKKPADPTLPAPPMAQVPPATLPSSAPTPGASTPSVSPSATLTGSGTPSPAASSIPSAAPRS